MKPKHTPACAFMTAIALLSLSASNALAADRKTSTTIVSFPSVSVGRIEIIRIYEDPARNTIVSKMKAMGKVVVPHDCAINLELNYAGSQNTDFLLALPPSTVCRFGCNQLEMSDKAISNIGHLTKLFALDLEATEMNDTATHYLSGLKELRHLNMGATLITAHGLSFTAGMNKLLWLRLSRNNNLGDAMGPSLSRLTSLKNLDLCGTNLDNATLAYLTPLSSLEELNIRRNNISDKGLAYIAKLNNLKRLDVTDTLVTAKGLKLLAGLPKLKEIAVRMRYFKPQELATLKKLLPGVTIENGSREFVFPHSTFEPLH